MLGNKKITWKVPKLTFLHIYFVAYFHALYLDVLRVFGSGISRTAFLVFVQWHIYMENIVYRIFMPYDEPRFVSDNDWKCEEFKIDLNPNTNVYYYFKFLGLVPQKMRYIIDVYLKHLQIACGNDCSCYLHFGSSKRSIHDSIHNSYRGRHSGNNLLIHYF